MPNLEKILVRRSGSLEEWYSCASESGMGGFIIPRSIAPIGNKKEPFMTLEVVQHSNESIVISIDIRDHFLTMRVRRNQDGRIDFSPTSYRFPDGSLSPGVEGYTCKMDDKLGKYEVEKEELIPISR